jgi:hypothetical protein
VTGLPTGYAQLLVVPLGWASSYKADLVPLQKTSVKDYPPSFEDGCWNQAVPMVSTKELAEAAQLFLRIRELQTTKSGMAIALRRLNSSSLRTNGEDGLLDAMIGLEALLSDGSQEMTHKIALRLAALYKLVDPAKSTDVFKEIKRIYGFRSKIVHGSGDLDTEGTLDRGMKKIPIVEAAVEHLRTALDVLIQHPEYFDVARIDRELLIGSNPSCNAG